MQRHAKTVEPPIPNLEAMWNIDPQTLETLSRTYRTWFDQANRMRDEAIRFTQERFTKELDAAVRLSRCMNPTEALAVQTEFAKSMAADYFAEGQKLVDLMGEMTKEFSPKPKAHH
jgi:hypothetical protein